MEEKKKISHENVAVGYAWAHKSDNSTLTYTLGILTGHTVKEYLFD